MQIALEYIGFSASTDGRKYTFVARDDDNEPREYTVTIANQVFASRLAKYQDGPAISLARLRRELENASTHPETTCFSITVEELGQNRPGEYKTRPDW